MTDNMNKKARRAKVLMIVFSLLCSLMLWVYVTSTEKDDYTDTFSGVKVVFEGESTMRESRGLVLTSRGVTSVKISITGNRRAVSRIDAADLKASIDLSTITGTGRYTLAYKIVFPSGIDSSNLSVSAETPENISFTVDKLSTRSVDVRGIFSGSTAEGFSAEPLEFEPNTVRISGPQSAIDTVKEAVVEVSRENVDKTLSFDSNFVLVDADGKPIENDSIKCETESVAVTLPVVAIKEVTLTAKIINGGGATDQNVKYTIEPSTIVLSGDSDVLAGVNNIDIAAIDLSDVDDAFSKTYDIVIPNDTEIISGSKQAELELEIVGLEKKTVNVTNFAAINVTDGYKAEVMVNSISVTLRGTKEALSAVSDVNVRAVADMTDYGATTGIMSVPVKIYINGTTEVGVLGDYKIYINTSIAEDTKDE